MSESLAYLLSDDAQIAASQDGNGQPSLFENDPIWREHWQGMPEFIQGDREPVQKITINFATYEDAKTFGDLVGQTVSRQTDTLWFPKQNLVAPKSAAYVDEP